MQDEKNEKEKLEVRMQEMEMEMRHEKEKQSRETGELNARNKEMETRLEELEDRLTEEKDVSEKKMGDLEATVRMEVKEIASNFSNSNPSLRDLTIVIISAFKTGPIHSLQTVTFDSFLANYNNADRPGGGDGVLDLDSGVSLLILFLIRKILLIFRLLLCQWCCRARLFQNTSLLVQEWFTAS